MFIAVSLLIVWKDEVQWKTHRMIVLKVFFASLFGYFLQTIIQFIYFRPRPFVTNFITQLIDRSANASFPSGHTILAFAMAFPIYFYNKKLGAIILFFVFMIGLARIYVGVHYPLDILGGIFVGFLSAYAVEKVPWNKIFKNKI